MSSRKTRRIGVLDVQTAMASILANFGDEVNEVIDDALTTVAEEAEKELRNVRTFSSNGNPTGAYSKDWDLMIEPVRRYLRRYVVYNVDHYQLTHLLESGHAKYLWGREANGSVQGYEHIRPVNERVQSRVVDEIRERIADLHL